MTIPLIAKRKRSKAADVSRSPLMTTNSSFERESLSFSFSRRRRTVIPRCLLAASCEITVQISPWQSGSYSASLYSRLSRSSLVSASSLSPRIALLSISPLCAVRSAATFFPRGAEPTSWGRQSDSGQRLCSIREISKERRSTSVLHARNGERRIVTGQCRCTKITMTFRGIRPCSISLDSSLLFFYLSNLNFLIIRIHGNLSSSEIDNESKESRNIGRN